MSPFSITFRELRIFSGLRQAEFAAQLGYEQSYISAIELGTKGPPTVDFVARLIHCFELDDGWGKRLLDALEASHRKITLPSEASEELYKMFNELRRQLDKLHPAQVELMQVVLRLPESMSPTAAKSTVFPRRKVQRNKGKIADQ